MKLLKSDNNFKHSNMDMFDVSIILDLLRLTI